jgi:hypothetical protein
MDTDRQRKIVLFVKVTQAMMAAGVPMPHRYIIWLDWLRRADPALAHLLETNGPPRE